jgi:hypothetical protein
MPIYQQPATKDIALTTCFTALYVVLSFLPMFQVIGFFGKTITAATIVAPIIGILLGEYLGVMSTVLGGIIGLLLNPSFSQPSFAAGVVAALCASLLYNRKRALCALTYLVLLLLFALFPSVGPFWLYPPLMWFQIVGFLILISPLQSFASKNFRSENNSRLLSAFFITSLTSTLASQIAGSLIFELVVTDATTLKGYWLMLTFLYPEERTIIALIATFIGVSLYKVLRATNLLRLSGIGRSEK